MGLSPKINRLPSPSLSSPSRSDTPSPSRTSGSRYPPFIESNHVIPAILFDDNGDEGGNHNNSNLILNARRRAAGMIGYHRTTDDYGILPNHLLDSLPLMSRSSSSNSTAEGVIIKVKSKLRWRTIIIGVSVLVVVLLLVPASNRPGAHRVLTSAGVPLPDRIISDRVRDFFDGWRAPDDGSGDLLYVPYSDDDEEANDEEGLWTEKEDAHNYNPNGHFIVTPPPTTPSHHPITTLIKRAEHEWNKKVRKQSRTLEAAVKEYRRRYTRNPPKGFDQWWEYANANRIVLTDEYDQIHRDLEPFWALEPSDLLHRTEMMEIREETFTISINSGKVSLTGEYAALQRAIDLGELISRFSSHVGDVNLTFTRHDQPAVQLGWYQKEKMLELAKTGEYFGPSDFVAQQDHTLSNWANGCPPNSLLRQVETTALNEPVTAGSGAKFKSHSPAYITELSRHRSFIYDHQSAMDICQHPEIMPIHGFTTAPGTNAGPLAPLFTFAKTNIHSDILVTPLEQYSDTYIGFDPDFMDKKENKVLWRGSTTGAVFDSHSDWRASQRSRLHFMTHERHGFKEVLVLEEEEETSGVDGEGIVREKSMEIEKMNRDYMDISFSGGPVQCDKETCALLKKVINFQPTMGLDESYQYKYVIDLDGNGWSGRFHRLMSMKAMVLKSTIFPEWYSDRIQPWLHYVPVKVDYADLYDIMTFFRGSSESGKEGHEELAAKIGLAGKRWARDHWRKQDMAAYMFRLSLEWSRLLHRGDDQLQDYTEFPN